MPMMSAAPATTPSGGQPPSRTADVALDLGRRTAASSAVGEEGDAVAALVTAGVVVVTVRLGAADAVRAAVRPAAAASVDVRSGVAFDVVRRAELVARRGDRVAGRARFVDGCVPRALGLARAETGQIVDCLMRGGGD